MSYIHEKCWHYELSHSKLWIIYSEKNIHMIKSLYTNFVYVFKYIYTNMISFRFTSHFFGVLIAHRSSITNDEIYLRAAEKYEKSMIAIIIGMWTRFIHWQNKLTIDYFRNVPTHLRIHTLAHRRANKSYRSIYSASKNENHSNGNHFLYIFKTFFIWNMFSFPLN